MSGETFSDRCPEAGLLAAFAERSIDRRLRTAVEKHLADCRECVVIVAATVQALDEHKPAGHGWRFLFAAALAIGLLLTSYWRLSALRDPLGGLRKVETAARPVEGRLDRFAYAEFDRRRSTAEIQRDLGARAAIAKILRRRDGNAVIRHARGIAFLFDGNVVHAMSELEAAARLQPANATYWNDLAVARIANGSLTRDPRDFGGGLAAANLALVRSPNLGPAHFNRALALERLARRQEAIASYRRALAAEPSSTWSPEIRQRIKELSASPP